MGFFTLTWLNFCGRALALMRRWWCHRKERKENWASCGKKWLCWLGSLLILYPECPNQCFIKKCCLFSLFLFAVARPPKQCSAKLAVEVTWDNSAIQCYWKKEISLLFCVKMNALTFLSGPLLTKNVLQFKTERGLIWIGGKEEIPASQGGWVLAQVA